MRPSGRSHPWFTRLDAPTQPPPPYFAKAT
jgi:hypothetical protein